ncbi:MAG TPA: O-methyltransferase [Pseudonocardia sp.]|jgi:predicted O-methyltransferase YrrM
MAVRGGDPRSRLDDEEAMLDAQDRAEEFGCRPIDQVDGAALRFLATALRARTVVEIGTGAGVSGLWLLRGMAPDGVLTSIDIEPEHTRAARAGFREAGYPPSRLRMINGMALEVLPRLADATYDLVFIDSVIVEYPRYLTEAVRLLRPGGVIAMHGVLDVEAWAEPVRGGVPGQRLDPESQARREVLRACQEHEDLVTLPLPLGAELLVAARGNQD